MCLVKSPKIVQAQPATDKPIPVLRNLYLDRVQSLQDRRTGVSSLRIDRKSPHRFLA